MPLNVLVIDRSPPGNTTQGNELIARFVFPRLRGAHRLTLVAPATGDLEAARASIADLFDEVHLVPRARRIPSLVGSLEPLAARRGLRVHRPLDAGAAAELAATIRRVAGTSRPDVVHVRQLAMAGFGSEAGSAPRLLELIDSETLASARDPDRSLRSGLRRRLATAIEARAIRGYDVVTTVAEPDAAAVRGLRPGARVEVVRNGVEADVFRPDPHVAVDRENVVFLGAMSFPPNVAAATWFATVVLPRVHASRPTATFTVVGRDPVPEVAALAALPGVTVTGRVDDVRPYLAGAALVVAPMVSGSGIKNKVLEAMAMGRPVVATSLAVEGLAADRGREIVVVDGAAPFADQVLALLGDPTRAEAIAAAGRALVESTYTWDAAAERYARLYAELAARSGT